MYEIQAELTQDFILANVSQEEIFEHFLNVPVEYNAVFRSPLRKDDNPTCTFKRMPSGVILYRDWAEYKPKNCFQVVMEIYNCTYYQALQYIDIHLLQNRTNLVYINKSYNSKSYNKSDKKQIDVKLNKTFQKEAANYLKQYHLTNRQIKKFKFFPVDKAWLNGKLIYKYTKYDPAIAYYFGKNENEQRWKIYFFTRKQYRFMGNTNRINGWVQLPETGEHLVITKSLKDVACLDVFNMPSIAMQNETTIPYDYIIDELKQRFTNIVSLYDFDRTGVVNANKLKRLYNIPYLFFKNVPNVKDFSDYVKFNGITKTQELINEILHKNI